MSLLLARLDAGISETTDPVSVAELKVRKACYLARTGFLDEARQIVLDLRIDFGAGQNGRISVWIMLAEGLVEFFTCPGSVARDRIARAELIAVAMNDEEIAAIACAWKALIEFEFSNFQAMAVSLRRAYGFAKPENREACSRIGIILSDCFYLCGDRENGQYWFMLSRDHALKDGDRATIDALLYNRAAFSTANLRVKRCFGEVGRDLVDLVAMEVASARNFQELADIRSVNHLIKLCEARIKILTEDFEAAVSALEVIRSQGPFASYNFDLEILDLEVAYCLLRLRRLDDANKILMAVETVDYSTLDIDDRLVMFWLKSEISRLGGKIELEENFECTFKRIVDEYNFHQSSLMKLTHDLAGEWKLAQGLPG